MFSRRPAKSSRPLQLSDLSLLYAATSVRCSSNQPGNVSTRLYRRGGCLTDITRACSASRRASSTSRPYAANRVREFSAFRRKVQSLARRGSAPRRGQSYHTDHHRRRDATGRRADDRLRRTGHDAGSDRRALAYDLRGAEIPDDSEAPHQRPLGRQALIYPGGIGPNRSRSFETRPAKIRIFRDSLEQRKFSTASSPARRVYFRCKSNLPSASK
jgi:hypothetical protein